MVFIPGVCNTLVSLLEASACNYSSISTLEEALGGWPGLLSCLFACFDICQCSLCSGITPGRLGELYEVLGIEPGSALRASVPPAVKKILSLLWSLDSLAVTLPYWGPFPSFIKNNNYNPDFMMRMNSMCYEKSIVSTTLPSRVQAFTKSLLNEQSNMDLSFYILICFALRHIHLKFCLQCRKSYS